MLDFSFWFRNGLQHITDPNGADHLLFLAALCAPWPPRAWKKLLLLATAFTAGHSLSLALAVLGVVSINAYIVELLIPVTILVTAVLNVATGVRTDGFSRKALLVSYFVAFDFGLIHGLGFSTNLRDLLGDSDVALPLLAFNLGLEAGQLVIVAATVSICFLVLKTGLAHRWWNWVLSGAAVLLSLMFLIERL